jgi:ATP-dependent DNA helicase
MYHGTPAERAELRRTKMEWYGVHPSSSKKATSLSTATEKNGKKRSSNAVKNLTRRSKLHTSPSKEESSRRSIRLKTTQLTKSKRLQQASDDDSDDGGKSYIPSDESDGIESDENSSDTLALRDDDEPQQETSDSPRTENTFPIILTTYEMIIKDRQYLSKYEWNFIVVDEGHRLKNMDCKCAVFPLHPLSEIGV